MPRRSWRGIPVQQQFSWRVYVDGPVGVENAFGGKKDRGSKPSKSVKGSGPSSVNTAAA